MEMKREPKDLISEYTSKVLASANGLRDSKYQQSESDVALRWRLGLGSNFKLINDAIDVLGHIPQGWDTTNLFLLMGVADSFEKNHKCHFRWVLQFV